LLIPLKLKAVKRKVSSGKLREKKLLDKLEGDGYNTVEKILAEGRNFQKVISCMNYKSQAGTNDNGTTKINQDSHVIIENVFGFDNFNIYGVLDGHGIY
jgi:hypothetical protein